LDIERLCPRADYIFFDPDTIYMNWALLSAGLSNSTASQRYALDRASGPRLFTEFSRIADSTRALAGSLFGYGTDRVFLCGNATTALFSLLDLFKTQYPLGTVITTDRQYATILLAVGSEFDNVFHCEPRTDAFIQALDVAQGPSMLVIEGQEYRSGGRYDINGILQKAREKRQAGTDMFVTLDLSQWPCPDWQYSDFTSIFVSAPKWSGGASGSSYGLVAPELDIKPTRNGWGSLEGNWVYPVHSNFKSSAARLDALGGGKPWLPLYHLEEGLSHIARLGMHNIESHVVGLAHYARQELVAAGLDVIPVEHESGNVAISFPSPEKAREFLLELVNLGVVLSDGVSRLRISPMPCNCGAEMTTVIDAIKTVHAKFDYGF